MSRFEFTSGTRILFGEGVFRETAPITSQLGRCILVASGIGGQPLSDLMQALVTLGNEVYLFEISSEPTIDSIQPGLDLARDQDCEVIIGLGGGSAIDTGKIIAILVKNPGEVLDYLEVFGKGQELKMPGLPLVAVPTTAGTGAEVTRNAVIGSPEHGAKASLRSPFMQPRVAVVDPELTYSLPANITAYTGMDALTQVIEPFVSVAANPLTDAFCREGILRGSRSLLKAYLNGEDKEARSDMALASLLGGLALANAKLGAVHGFAGPLGGRFSMPHGAICARLLPIVMDVNIHALTMRQPTNPAIQRYHEIARMVTGSQRATAIEGVNWINELCVALGIPSLSYFGFNVDSIADMVEMASVSSSMKGNPIQLTIEEMKEILARAL